MSDARPTRPEPTSSPALAGVLMDGCRVTTDTLRQILASLADAGWFRVEWQKTPEIPMLRITRRLGFDNIPRPYEQLVLQRIEHLAGEQPDVPLAWVISNMDVYGWEFTEAVLDEAKAAGLIRRVIRWRGGFALWVASGPFFGLAMSQVGATIGSDITAGFFGAIGPGALLAVWLANPIRTRAGRDVVRRARGGPYADALLADGSALPEAALPRDQAWSSYGGRWHTVTVPAFVDPRRERNLPEDRRQVTGQVVNRSMQLHYTGRWGTSTYTHFCCVDDGVSAEGWLFPVSESEFEQLEVGALITMEVMPYRLRFGRQP